MAKTFSQSTRSNKVKPTSESDLANVYLAEVVAVNVVHDFTVNVTFSDGTIQVIDLEPYLHGPIFRHIRQDANLFRAVGIRDGTVGWENGADIDPDTLYYDGKPPWALTTVTKKEPRPKERKRP